MFKKILIANRGEIAVRIIRACRDLGIKSAAVFSDADRYAQHVRLADEAYNAGPPPSAESYLDIKKIIEIAKKSGAEAIHPGYGFLAENSVFAAAVVDAGIEFIGPPSEAIKMMGDKLAARAAMIKSGVPIVPGTETLIEDEEESLHTAKEIGFPVLIKAAAGGGGKGMRVVNDPKDMKSAMRGAASEAKTAFGDDRMYIEKYLPKPRHIEIQIIADKHGNYVYLGERECSIQRRHQKVIEEAPSPVVNNELRYKMGQAAVAAAKACNYSNAGTVEFLVDADMQYYFLEMNTRLQVEHPVTEMITGRDLATEQIRIAAGERLSFKQDDISISGHAIECRIYAEDPVDFLPAVGTINHYCEPAGPGVRVDSGVYEGVEISVYYDPLIAKLITYGENRHQAIARMKRALDEYIITGVTTNISFHQKILDNTAFIDGKLSTHFIAEYYEKPDEMTDKEQLAIAVAAVLEDHTRKNIAASFKKTDNKNWKISGRPGSPKCF
ncbi:MAG: acetyl-CoA carboxylase biotin carboxylase subunit [candidate division Zixibacteria bacterium]|nr:acetyl-CoA carboxylase biotin carboxylase subunit [candidate division Zixibacteria bacterium]